MTKETKKYIHVTIGCFRKSEYNKWTKLLIPKLFTESIYLFKHVYCSSIEDVT